MPPNPLIAFLGLLQGHILPAEHLYLSWRLNLPLSFRLNITQGAALL